MYHSKVTHLLCVSVLSLQFHVDSEDLGREQTGDTQSRPPFWKLNAPTVRSGISPYVSGKEIQTHNVISKVQSAPES